MNLTAVRHARSHAPPKGLNHITAEDMTSQLRRPPVWLAVPCPPVGDHHQRRGLLQFASRGITVNAVCAGITDDSIVNQLPQEAQDPMLGWLRSGWNPMGRPGTPADIGGAVVAIGSDDANWITGQTIVADGGASLMSAEVPLAFQQRWSAPHAD